MKTTGSAQDDGHDDRIRIEAEYANGGLRARGAPGIFFSRSTIMPTPPSSAAPVSCKLAIKAIPNAPRNAVAGWLGDALKVKVHAPALEGRANDELCEFLAGALGLPRRAVTVAHGDKSRQKLLHISGLSLDEAKARLGV